MWNKTLFFVWLGVVIFQFVLGVVSYIMWEYYRIKLNEMVPFHSRNFAVSPKWLRPTMLIMSPFGGGIVLMACMLLYREDYKKEKLRKVEGILDRL